METVFKDDLEAIYPLHHSGVVGTIAKSGSKAFVKEMSGKAAAESGTGGSEVPPSTLLNPP